MNKTYVKILHHNSAPRKAKDNITKTLKFSPSKLIKPQTNKCLTKI